MNTDEKQSSQVLTSWKEVATYLSKGVRTVQRWERELGLPIRRPSRSRHIILAVPAELDQWVLQQQSASDHSHHCNYSRELAIARDLILQLRAQVARLESELSALRSSRPDGEIAEERRGPQLVISNVLAVAAQRKLSGD